MKKIFLTKGKFALVDDDVYKIVSNYSWHYISNGYAKRSMWINGKTKDKYMHREIYEIKNGKIPDDKCIDHINNNKLDNRIENLRLATSQENSFNQIVERNKKNSSKYKGVYKHKQTGNFVAHITINNKRICIGSFTDEVACANAYNQYARKHFGEYAKLNEVEYMDEESIKKYQLRTTNKNNYKGIIFRNDTMKWRITLYDLDSKRVNLGCYEDLNEAIRVRNNYLINNDHLLVKYKLTG